MYSGSLYSSPSGRNELRPYTGNLVTIGYGKSQGSLYYSPQGRNELRPYDTLSCTDPCSPIPYPSIIINEDHVRKSHL
jgi:hypothetical protein